MVDHLMQPSRRRADAHSVAETLASAPEGAIVKTFTLAGNRTSAVYNCGCVAGDPYLSTAPLQKREFATHPPHKSKLRRRHTDRS
jgi:hypothetical protein